MSMKDDIFKEISDSYKISCAFERWKDYRTRVTDYIIKYTQQGKSIAILGAGESNDIDLERLYQHMGNLTLVDKNSSAMKAALQKYNLSGKANIKLVTADFFGITDAEYKEIIGIYCQEVKRMKNMFSPMATAPKIIEKMDDLYKRINDKKIDLGVESYDYIVAIGVHSQLNGFIEHSWDIVLRATGKTNDQISKKAMEENDLFIPRFNDAIMEKTNERAFIGLELFENGRNCMVQGAEQAKLDIYSKVPEEKLLGYRDVWPLKEGVSYNMMIYNIKKNDYSIS